jgi:hypothetical protein
MPLTEKGEKIKGAMEKQYGSKKGEEVFYASKNKGKISGVDDMEKSDRVPLEEGKSKETVNKNVNRLLEKGHSEEAAIGIAQRKAKNDDNQHMGFTGGDAPDVKKLVSMCDALSERIDAFERKRSMQRPEKVKPRTKDNMQPSDPHPKEVREPGGA